MQVGDGDEAVGDTSEKFCGTPALRRIGDRPEYLHF
jgi:hypothetical protein